MALLGGIVKNVGSSLGPALGAGAGSLFGGLFNSAGSMFLSKELMKYQNKLYTQSLRDYGKNMRYSYESAGFNPLLALGANASGMTPSATMQMTSDPASSAISMMNLKNQQSATRSQNRVNDATKENLEANSAKALQDIENSKRITQAQIDNLKSETKYNNEKSRGYTTTKSRTFSGGAFGIKGNYSYTDSSTR